MDRKNELEYVRDAGSKLFSAQNELSIAWNELNTKDPAYQAAQAQIDAAQDAIRNAIKALGGVDFLCRIGS